MINNSLIEKLFRRDKRAVARAISVVEADNESNAGLQEAIFSKTGSAYRIGITGPPGAGKSTIVNQITKQLRDQGNSIGIIAVDPTSPFTGGALLGDRVRMNDIGNDPAVFIRSMATRGSLGGLSRKTVDAGDVLDAAGYNYVIFETVGVGQSELDIANAADTTIVILVPESGDSVQAMKAGLMEIADFFVLNKSDRPGSEQAVAALKTILMMKAHTEKSWLPPIIKTIASENKGISDILLQINNHRKYLESNDLFLKRRQIRLKTRIKEIVEDKLRQKLWGSSDEKVAHLINDLAPETLSPYHIAEKIIENFKNQL